MNELSYSSSPDLGSLTIHPQQNEPCFQIFYEKGQNNSPNYGYSIGMYQNNYPEFIVFGLSQTLAKPLIANMCHKILAGLDYPIDAPFYEALFDHQFCIRKIDSFFIPQYLISQAESIHKIIDVFQIVVADLHGFFPWDEAYQGAINQPPLYYNRHV
jgi:TM2 domain-containing membrane protein YozV